MKSLAIAVVMICFTLCGFASPKGADAGYASDTGRPEAASDDSADAPVQLLRFTANVDGSGRFIFTRRNARYEHMNWSPPTNVNLNGQPWTKLDQTPSEWRQFSRGLDLSRAWVVKREGRDVIALEQTPAGFDLYVADTPNGSADYSMTIAIPRTR